MTGSPPGPAAGAGQADPLHELLTLVARNTKAVTAMIATIIAIAQPRTVRNLVHSACTRCQKLSRPAVARERYGVTGAVVMTSPRPGTQPTHASAPCRPARGWPDGQ